MEGWGRASGAPTPGNDPLREASGEAECKKNSSSLLSQLPAAQAMRLLERYCPQSTWTSHYASGSSCGVQKESTESMVLGKHYILLNTPEYREHRLYGTVKKKSDFSTKQYSGRLQTRPQLATAKEFSPISSPCWQTIARGRMRLCSDLFQLLNSICQA